MAKAEKSYLCIGNPKLKDTKLDWVELSYREILT